MESNDENIQKLFINNNQFNVDYFNQFIICRGNPKY